jgi:hypothetical protein
MDGKEGNPTQRHLNKIAEEGLENIDPFCDVIRAAHPDAFDIVAYGTTEGYAERFVEAKQREEQDYSDPIWRILDPVQQGSAGKHQYDDETGIDKGGLYPIAERRIERQGLGF